MNNPFDTHPDNANSISSERNVQNPSPIIGTMPFSDDILAKANIGLWAFEFDEGKSPRMYIDGAMMTLLGLEHPLSPEETYHAWYDHVDKASYTLVDEAIAKMSAGEHAEVQYPWHYPNGRTIVVRCGGVRNHAYKAGVRIEGTHQDVTQVLHFDETEQIRIRHQEQDLMYSNFRVQALAYLADQHPDTKAFIQYAANKILEVGACDQVIFFHADGQKYFFNAPDAEGVPPEFYDGCPLENLFRNKHFGDSNLIILNDCASFLKTIPGHPDCAPVKSACIQQIMTDGKPACWMIINYISTYHTFSPEGIDLLKMAGAYIGLILEKIHHTKVAEELVIREASENRVKEYREIVEVLASEYSSIYYVNLHDNTFKTYAMDGEAAADCGSVLNSDLPYTEAYAYCVDNLVAPADQVMMRKVGSLENIRRELAHKKTFSVYYHNNENKYSEMKCVKVGNEDDEPLAATVAFADKDAQLREEMEAKRYSEIAKALSEKYESIYYINILDDSYIHFHSKESYANFLPQESGENFFEESLRNLVLLAEPEDREPIQAFIDKAQLLKTLKTDSAALPQYKLTYGKASHYFAMRAVKPNPDEPYIIIAVANIDDEVQRREDYLALQSQSYEVIKILASEYSSVYYIDLTTDALNPYTMNEETETTFGSVFRSGITYSEAYNLYVEKLVYPSNRSMMLKVGSIENIRKELCDKKTFLTTYLDSNNKYCEMKFVKVGTENDTPLAVALGFSEKDEQIRKEEAARQERQMNFDIIEILASEYSSVYYIDLTTDGLNPYSMNAETETTFGSVFRSGITYSEAYNLYVEKLVYPSSKSMMLKAGSIENIRRELCDKKTFLTTYLDSNNKYCEMKFVKVGAENDTPLAVALGFSEKDEQIRKEEAARQERQMNFDIIEILASEYSSVYYIDLTTDGLNPYSMNAETETTFGSVFRSGITYSEAYRLYVGKLVYPEDKGMMLKAGSIGNIMKELRTKKTFLTTYRSAEGHYCEMKFVKVGNAEGAPTAVALGFADKDEELRSKQEEERILQRNIEIIEILASEYSSVYYIDMTTDGLNPYTMNEQTESRLGKIFRSGIQYSQAFRLYVDELVYPTDKPMMLKAGSIYNILNELSTKKTFITQYRNSDGEYCEMKFVKVGDDENPQSVALGFSNKDSEIRKEIQRKERQDRDNAVIKGLSDDFGCVVYTNFYDYSEIPYRFDPLFESHIEGWSKMDNFRDRLQHLTETLVHPEDRKLFLDATQPTVVHAAIDRDGVYFVNFRLLVDGEEIYYQAKFVRDEVHPESNVIAGFHNVDAEMKREMKALKEAKSANKSKTDFLFNMSHDIRTPMNAIMGFTDIAMKNVDDRERVIDSLSKTKQAGKLLLSLINNILDMSRIESGRIKLEEDEGDVTLSFVTIESTMQELAKAKNIHLSFSIGSIQDRYIYWDDSRCMRIFVNIISNAIKYTNEGGHVKVFCEQIGREGEFGLYRYTFEDNGIGMSEEFQKRAFDEFSRENTATVSGVQGTGLGLSVCRSFVQAMNGTITCKSKQGEGTTFTVTLPLKLQKGKNDTDPLSGNVSSGEPSIEADFNGKRVLLVEDNELNCEISEFILSEEGMEVETANDGSIAVRMLTEKGSAYYDFILMDIQMPIMDGYEATGEIRKMYPDAAIPIIALSANAFAEDKTASIAAGMNDHVAKPIDMTELKAVMSKYIH